MAIYHLHVKPISRADGRSAVASAAYRHAAKMKDEAKNKTFNYTRKEHVVHNEINLPDNPPDWLIKLMGQDSKEGSAKLWNHIEQIEKRRDAQLAREVEFALPLELTLSQQIELARAFIQEAFTKQGMVADWTIHEEKGNPHVHVMLTLREITQTGFGNKAREWNSKSMLQSWRELWAEHANHYLFAHGIDARIDHRSYRERGIELIPAQHEGKAVRDLHKRGIMTEVMRESIAIRRENLARIANNPTLLLDKLTTGQSHVSSEALASALASYAHIKPPLMPDITVLNEQARGDDESLLDNTSSLIKTICQTLELTESVFSEQDIAKAVALHTKDANSFAKALIALKASPELLYLGLGEDGRARYTSKHMFDAECEVEALADKLRRHKHVAIDITTKNKAIKAYEKIKGKKLTQEQRDAVNHMLKRTSIACVVGRAGTGKSFSLGAANAVWQAKGLRVHGIALSGIAADGLTKDAGIESRTIESFRRALDNGLTLSDKDVVVMDESGMTDTPAMLAVLRAVYQAKAKLVLVGDSAQLQPVGPGAVFRALLERVGFAEIYTIYRQRFDWQRAATQKFAKGDVASALLAYHEHGMVSIKETPDDAMASLVDDWYQDYQTRGGPLGGYLVLAHRNEDVKALNARMRALRVARGELTEGYSVKTKQGNIRIAAGDRLLCLENNAKLGLSNGRFMTVQSVNMTESGKVIDFMVMLDGQTKPIRINPKKYEHFHYGYAATVHKSQGVTVKHSYVFAGGYGWNRHLSYVAGSRHEESLKFYGDATTHPNIETLAKNLGRYGLKDSILDFPLAFLNRRGIDGADMLQAILPKHLAKRLVTKHEKLKSRYQHALATLGLATKNQARSRVVLEEAAKEAQIKRQDAILVATYQDAHRQVGMSFGELKTKLQDFGLEQVSFQKEDLALISQTAIYQQYLQDTVTRDKLAFEVVKDLARYEIALEANRIDETLLRRHARNHERRGILQAYQAKVNEGNILIRDKMAAAIVLFIKEDYSLIKQMGIAPSILNAHAKAHDRRVFALTLNPKERKLFKLAIQYDELSRTLTKTWFENKEATTPLSYQAAKQDEALNLERDAMASHLLSHKDEMQGIFDMLEIGHAKAVTSPFQTQEEADKAALARLVRLEQAASRHEAREHVNAYYEAWAKGDVSARFREAYAIMQAPKSHHGAILGLPANTKNIWQSIRKDAKTLEELWVYQALDKDEKKAYKILKRYADAKKAHNSAWREAFYQGDNEKERQGATSTPKDERATLSASRYTEARNALASLLASDFKSFKIKHPRLIEHFHIQEEDVFIEAHQHACQQTVQDYIVLSEIPGKRFELSSLARLITENPQDYKKHIRAYQLNWKVLYKDARLAEQKANMDFLSNDEKALYRLNRRYKSANRYLGKLMSMHGELIKSGLTEHIQTKLSLATAKRDYLAYRVALQAKACNPHLTLHGYQDFLRCDTEKLEKQAAKHDERLQALDVIQGELQNAKLGLFELAYQAKTLSPDEAMVVETKQKALTQLAKKQKLHQDKSSLSFAMVTKDINPLQIKQDLLAIEKASQTISHFTQVKSQTSSITAQAPTTSGTTVPIRQHYPKMRQGDDLRALRELLNAQADTIVPMYLGEPKKRNGGEWRFGSRKGSLVVKVSGEKQGLWHDFQTDAGGGMLEFLIAVGGFSFKDAIHEAKRLVGWHDDAPKPIMMPKKVVTMPKSNAELDAKIQKVRDIVLQTKPIKGTLAERYLKEYRGIDVPIVGDLRFHPRLYNSETKSYLPAMVSVAKNVDGQIFAIQSTYLDAKTAKKATLESVKITRGSLKDTQSAVVIQQGTGSSVAVAEGVETALSVAKARPEWTVFASLGISNMGHVPLPKDVTEVIICADNDGEGSASIKALQKAADILVTKGITVYMAKPSQAGFDFNDVLLKEGIATVDEQLAHAPFFKAPVNAKTIQDDLKQIALSFKDEPSFAEKAKEIEAIVATAADGGAKKTFWESAELSEVLKPFGEHPNPSVRSLVELQEIAASNGLSDTLEAGLNALTEELYQNPLLQQELKTKVPTLYEKGRTLAEQSLAHER